MMPERSGEPRFGVLFVAPMTIDRGQEWAGRSPTLYPRFPEGPAANLKSPYICLLDQARALDAGPVRRYRGSLNRDQYRPVRDGLRRIFGYTGGREALNSKSGLRPTYPAAPSPIRASRSFLAP
jgi:mRNA interferase MazF